MTANQRVPTLLWALFLTLLAGCDRADSRQFPGEYVYRSKRGQIESLTFKEDGGFLHAVYPDEKTFLADGTPLYSLEGKWIFKDGKRTVQILNLHPSLSPFTQQPGQLYYADLPWTPAFEGKPAIVLDESQFYWLVRIQNRADIVKQRFRYP